MIGRLICVLFLPSSSPLSTHTHTPPLSSGSTRSSSTLHTPFSMNSSLYGVPPSPRVPLECAQGAQSPPLVARSKECSTFLIPTPTSHALLPSMAPWRTQPPPVVTCPSSSPTLSPVSVHLMEWKELRFQCVWWSQ